MCFPAGRSAASGLGHLAPVDLRVAVDLGAVRALDGDLDELLVDLLVEGEDDLLRRVDARPVGRRRREEAGVLDQARGGRGEGRRDGHDDEREHDDEDDDGGEAARHHAPILAKAAATTGTSPYIPWASMSVVAALRVAPVTPPRTTA